MSTRFLALWPSPNPSLPHGHQAIIHSPPILRAVLHLTTSGHGEDFLPDVLRRIKWKNLVCKRASVVADLEDAECQTAPEPDRRGPRGDRRSLRSSRCGYRNGNGLLFGPPPSCAPQMGAYSDGRLPSMIQARYSSRTVRAPSPPPSCPYSVRCVRLASCSPPC